MIRSDKPGLLERVRNEAQHQIAVEDFAARVAAEKVRLREHRTLLQRLFPYRIQFVKR